MQFLRIKTLLHHKVTLFLCCWVALVSCEDPNELGLGLVDDTIAGKYTDTLTVNVSTVYLDSLTTSGTGNMLAGQYTDPYSGTALASTFFQVGLGGAAWTVAEDAIFDSLTLLLPYSGYSYGDTTQAVTYNIYKLTESITPRKLSPYFFNEEPYSVLYADNALYNTSATDTASEALNSFTIVPRPATKDTLEIALSDELGQEWLSLKKAGDANLTDATNFLSYFPGLQITSTDGNAVIGFAAGSTKVRLYYTETVNGAATAKTRDFAVVNPNLQYNQFLTNLEGSELAALVQGGEPLPASQTGGVSVAQSGTGLMIKIVVPHLASLKGRVPPDLINRAVLVVEPLSNTAQYPYPAPLEMGLYSTNSSNVPLAPLLSGPEAMLTADYKEPDQQNAGGRYDFNLTPYLVELLKQEEVSDLTLLLAAPISPYKQGVNRLVVGGPGSGQQSIKLKIYYTTIK